MRAAASGYLSFCLVFSHLGEKGGCFEPEEKAGCQIEMLGVCQRIRLSFVVRHGAEWVAGL